MKELLDAAIKVREFAVAPYSNFKVGAAVLTSSGKIYSGCNVESVTFTLTSHAEINAISNAIANGEKQIKKLLVVGTNYPPGFPCAICRQYILEHCDQDVEIITANLSGEMRTSTISKLYPEA